MDNGGMAAAAPLTDLIRGAQIGESGALHGLFDAAYDDLCRLARARLRKSGRNTLLDTTSLVHESFLRVIGTLGVRIGDRQHFMRYASHVMRSIIVDELRSRLAIRRGGG